MSSAGTAGTPLPGQTSRGELLGSSQGLVWLSCWQSGGFRPPQQYANHLASPHLLNQLAAPDRAHAVHVQIPEWTTMPSLYIHAQRVKAIHLLAGHLRWRAGGCGMR